jgi:hypothetical protein
MALTHGATGPLALPYWVVLMPTPCQETYRFHAVLLEAVVCAVVAGARHGTSRCKLTADASFEAGACRVLWGRVCGGAQPAPGRGAAAKLDRAHQVPGRGEHCHCCWAHTRLAALHHTVTASHHTFDALHHTATASQWSHSAGLPSVTILPRSRRRAAAVVQPHSCRTVLLLLSPALHTGDTCCLLPRICHGMPSQGPTFISAQHALRSHRLPSNCSHRCRTGTTASHLMQSGQLADDAPVAAQANLVYTAVSS